MNPISNVIKKWHEEAQRQGHKITILDEATDDQGRPNDFMHVVKMRREGIPYDLFYLLRQDSVVIFPVIHYRSEIYTLLGNEYRGGGLRHLTSLPAESLDKSDEDILEAAKRGLGEEVCIEPEWITNAKKIDVGSTNYASPGGSNEQIHLVRVDVELPDGVTIEDLDGKVGGLEEEGEHITSCVRQISIELLDEIHTEGGKLALMKVLWDMEHNN